MLHSLVLRALEREMHRRFMAAAPHYNRRDDEGDWRNYPDQRIGTEADPYLDRWFVIPKNRFFNIYLHHFRRSDEDRALHDHPWLFNASWILRGEYDEVKFANRLPRMYERQTERPTKTKRRREGSTVLRLGPAPHRVVLLPWYVMPQTKRGYRGLKPVWTIFITGPNVRRWGFYCPQRWVHWKEFVGADGMKGKGCE